MVSESERFITFMRVRVPDMPMPYTINVEATWYKKVVVSFVFNGRVYECMTPWSV
jgi:hypothetical protein